MYIWVPRCVCVRACVRKELIRLHGLHAGLSFYCWHAAKSGFSPWAPYRCKRYIFRQCVFRAHYFDSLSYERKLKVLRNNYHPFCGLCVIVLSTRRTQQVMPIEPVHPHSLVWALAARRCDTYHSLMRWLKWPQVWVVRSHSLPVLLKNYMCIMHVCALARNMENYDYFKC